MTLTASEVNEVANSHMMSHDVSQLANLSKETIWQMFNDHRKHRLVFPDGDLVARGRTILINWYGWWLARECELTTEIKKSHFVTERYRKGTMLRLHEGCTWHLINKFNLNAEEVGKDTKAKLNEFKTDVETRWGSYVTSLSADDYHEVMTHPLIREAIEELQGIDFEKPGALMNAEMYVNRAQKKVEKILTSDDESLLGNRLYELTRSGQIDKVQVIKQVCCVGMCCDISSRIFRWPVVNSYGVGMRDHYSFLVESRSSSRALAYQKSPLEAVEYANREFQLLTDSLCNLHRNEDCGTDKTVPWLVTKGCLKNLNGLYYSLTPHNAQFDDYVRKNSHDLVGKTIYLRLTVTCEHPDRNGVCEVCFGRLSKQVPNGTNIGHVSIVVLGSNAAQKVLSLKHVEGSANSMQIEFPEELQEHIYSNTESSNIFLSKPEQGHLRLLVKQDELHDLASIDQTNVGNLDASTITKIDKMILEIVDEDGDEEALNIDIAAVARDSYFTLNLLQYIKVNRYKRRSDGHVEFDLSNWNYDKAILKVPKRHASMLDFLAEIKGAIQNKNGHEKLKEELTPSYLSSVLRQFSELVMSQFNINLTHLSTILRSTMAVDPKEGDFRIPLETTDASFAKYRDIVFSRSVQTAMAYQEIAKVLYNVDSYRRDNKQYHVLDSIISGEI